jgi:methionyl-tRNA synthetase
MAMVSFADFKKIELRIARIVDATPVTGSDKLVLLKVSLGRGGDSLAEGLVEETYRQVVAGIGLDYTAESLPGKQIVIVENLQPRKLMGQESQGMLLAAEDVHGRPVILQPDKEVPDGSSVR